MIVDYQSCQQASAVYGLGFIGAAVYFLKNATNFWNGVWGVVKAIFWPAFLVYQAFVFLNKKG